MLNWLREKLSFDKKFKGTFWTWSEGNGWDLIKFQACARSRNEVEEILAVQVKDFQYICYCEVVE